MFTDYSLNCDKKKKMSSEKGWR